MGSGTLAPAVRMRQVPRQERTNGRVVPAVTPRAPGLHGLQMLPRLRLPHVRAAATRGPRHGRCLLPSHFPP